MARRISDIEKDQVRAEIDEVFAEILGLKGTQLNALRNFLGAEPGFAKAKSKKKAKEPENENQIALF